MKAKSDFAERYKVKVLVGPDVSSRSGLDFFKTKTQWATPTRTVVFEKPISLSGDSSDCYYSPVYEAERRWPPRESIDWAEWNFKFIDIVSSHHSEMAAAFCKIEELEAVAQSIPEKYSIRDRLRKISAEVLEDDEYEKAYSYKSFLVMLRFLPIIQENERFVGFYVDESSRFGVAVSKKFDGHRQTLNILFKEDGELLFSYVDPNEGVSRISGSSYLTEYLSNSSKIRKIFNILDL